MLQVLNDLFRQHLQDGACDCDDKKIAEMAGKTAKKKKSGESSGKGKSRKKSQPDYGDEPYSVDMVVCARNGEKGRQYRVQWMATFCQRYY